MDPARVPRLSLDPLLGSRAAARHLSFAHAARELFVTRSAVSHKVGALEEQLATALFRRVDRTLQLTETGVQLYRALDAEAASAEAEARPLLHAPSHRRTQQAGSRRATEALAPKPAAR